MYLNTEWFLLFPHFLLLASFTALHRLSLWVFATALLKLLAASIFDLIFNYFASLIMSMRFKFAYFQKKCTKNCTYLSCRVNFDSCCHLAWSKKGRLERREENYKQKRWLQGWLLKRRIVQKDQPGVWRLHKTRFIVVCAIHCWISISFSMPLLSAHCTALHANRSAPLSSRVLLPLIRILPLTKSPPQRHTCQGGGANPVRNGAYDYNISVWNHCKYYCYRR